MPRLTPDQSFYPSPRLAMAAAAEKLAYVAMLNPDPQKPDALAVVDVDRVPQLRPVDQPGKHDRYRRRAAPFRVECVQSCLCPSHRTRTWNGGISWCRACVRRASTCSTPRNPREPRLVKVIEPEEVLNRTGYSRPHTAHCGPDGSI